MTRLIDADALHAQMIADAEQMDEFVAKMFTYVAANDVRHAPTIEAIPVEFIESEIKRMELEIDIAMSEDDDETAERWITRKTTLEFTLEKWRAEREEE